MPSRPLHSQCASAHCESAWFKIQSSGWRDAEESKQMEKTSLQPSMTPRTFVSTMRMRSASVFSDSGLYLYALLPALLILQRRSVSSVHDALSLVCYERTEGGCSKRAQGSSKSTCPICSLLTCSLLTALGNQSCCEACSLHKTAGSPFAEVSPRSKAPI